MEARMSVSYKWLLTRHWKKPSIYSDPGVYFLMLPGQGKMAGANTGVYKFDSMVRGQHVDNSVWMPLTDETHKLEENKCSEYTVNDLL